MKRTLVIIFILLFSIFGLAACSGGKNATLTGKYTIVSWEVDGQDWLAFFESMSAMADEGGEFNREAMYFDFQSDGKFLMNMSDETGELPQEGTYTVDGNTVKLTAAGEELSGIIDGNKIIIEQKEAGTVSKMVFEKK